MDGARGDWAADRERELRRSLARLEGYRRGALARDDQRGLAWAEELLGELALRRSPAPQGDSGQDSGPHQAR